jgi:hypothetical protein
MTKHSGGATINQGGAAKPNQDEAAAEFDITGNVALKGEKPSPGNRARGETSDADSSDVTDIGSASDRAS